MRRSFIAILFLLCAVTVLRADVIITKNNVRYEGRIVRRQNQQFIMRLTTGTDIAVPQKDVKEIQRGKEILELDTGLRYRLDTKYPYMPFAILGVATGAYAVNRFQAYGREKKRVEEDTQQSGFDDGTENTGDKSGQYLATGVVSALFSAGSFYMAFKPVQVRVPIGRIDVGMGPNEIRLSLHF